MTFMPLTYGITDEMGFDLIAHTLIGVVRGKTRQVNRLLRVADDRLPGLLHVALPGGQGLGLRATWPKPESTARSG